MHSQVQEDATLFEQHEMADVLQFQKRMKSEDGYGKLLTDGRFQAFLWTQFLGAFNDNVYKMIVSLLAVRVAVEGGSGARYLALAGAVFVIPFLLFAGYAGQLADRYSKTRVLQVTKSFEILVMSVGIAALVSARIELLLAVLFLLATQANFFSPAKYGILPETIDEANLARANGLLELSTFVAIVVGTSFGTFLFARWQGAPLRMGITLLAVAVAGSLASLYIRKAPSAGSREPFRWNPFHEIVEGARTLRARKPLALSVAGISWFWFVGALFQMAVLLAAKEMLHVPETRVGLLITALALGIGLGSIVAGAVSGGHIELGLVPAGSTLMGVFSIALGLTHSYHFALVWLAGVGFAGGLFVVPLNAFLQVKAGAREKGRLLATNNFANMLGVILASAALWLLHDRLGWNAGRIVVALGVVTIAGTVYIVRVLPAITVRFLLLGVTKLLFRIRVEGRENIPLTGGALLIANHISYADAVLVGYATPRIPRFLMWQPIFDNRIFRMFFEILDAIPIALDSPKNTIRALRAAKAELEQGELVAIFPEGHISYTGELEPFERGFERIVSGTGAPIVPIHVHGVYGHPLSRKGGDVFRSWELLWRPLITVRVGEPIYGPISPADLQQIVAGLAAGQELRKSRAVSA
jgi:acyl-[acyl-carrier-protein]-phospholipid O-acyltransferase/long-chain-fatty-acid--[acyl-carrier-protein] ligase